MYTEKKENAKMALLLESNFENRLSFVEESTKIKLHRKLSYGRPNGGSLFFFLSVFKENIFVAHSARCGKNNSQLHITCKILW